MLRAIAAAYEIKAENRFKIIAYDRAATAVEHATSEMKDLWDDNQLKTVPGIGRSIAGHLDELFSKGRVVHFKRVMKDLPAAMFEFLDIPGIGPKTAYKLCEQLRIKKKAGAIEKLKQAAQSGKIRGIEGFGAQSERELLAGVAELKRRTGRMLLPFAAELAERLIGYLKKYPQVKAVYPLGSLRRRCATIGDLDLAVKTNHPESVIKHFVSYPQVKKVVSQGRAKASVILNNNRQVDLRAQSQSFGAMLQYFTGSKHHNIHLREIGLKKGLSLSEYGIKVKGKLKEFATEKEFYRFLGLDWIPPEIREDKGEIEAAQVDQLPRLVKPEDIKGDLHTHSNFQFQESSHDGGVNTFEEVINQAIKMGYEYVGLGDHSPSASKHSSKEIITLLSKRKEVIEQLSGGKKFTQRSGRENAREIKILNTMEVDILADGSLAVPDKGLEMLDFAFVAVHSSMRQGRKTMTERVLQGLKHPKVRFLAHPTGRMLAKREGYELNWDKIFDFCLKNNKWLEVDAFPERLDLPDALVYEAIRAGVKLIIGSDAHEVEAMVLMRYGVDVARRGWAQKKDIINTLSWQQLVGIMKIKKET